MSSDGGFSVRQRKLYSEENENSLNNGLGRVPLRNYRRQLASRNDVLQPYHWLFVVFYASAIYCICLYFDRSLPQPLSPQQADVHLSADGPSLPSKLFSEIRARDCVNKLNAIGPRPTGSKANEQETVKYLLGELHFIASQHSQRFVGGSSKQHIHVEIDIQRTSGCYFMHFFEPLSSCYRNLTNIVARISHLPLQSSADRHALLVNAHFDTVPDSPGIGDDGASSCIMLEMFRQIVRSNRHLQSDLIFLWNGAEENFLQASHGFITQHPWRHTVRAFVNLEGAGSGGREMLFQAGPGNPWLVQTYLTHSPYPHTSVMAQEVFASGIVPSDTDFRIFRDFGYVPGLDIAFVKNGYVYHTQFDNPSALHEGSLQRAGENILATTMGLVNSTFLSNPGAYEAFQERWVYFEILGLVTIHYPHWFGQIMNMIACLAVWFVIAYRIHSRVYSSNVFLRTLGTHLIAFVAIAVSISVCVIFLTLTGFNMLWYARPYLIVAFYILPSAAVGLFTHAVIARRYLHDVDHIALVLASFDSVLLAWSSVLLLLTFLSAGSAYFFLCYAGMPLLRNVFLNSQSSCVSPTRLLLAQFLAILMPLTFASIGLMSMLDFFIPIMGRSGATVIPDVFIGVVAGLATISYVAYMSSLIYVTKHVGKLCTILLAVSLIIQATVIICPAFRFPYKYSENMPAIKRTIFECNHRNISTGPGNADAKVDSGIMALALDYRGFRDFPDSVKARAVAGNGHGSMPCVFDEYMCGYGIYLPIVHFFYNTSLWLHLDDKPDLPKTGGLSVSINGVTHTKSRRGELLVNISLAITGPDHITLSLTPNKPWILQKWSIPTPHRRADWNFLYLSDAAGSSTWNLWVVFTAPDLSAHADHYARLSVSSHYLHGEFQRSGVLKGMYDNVTRALSGEMHTDDADRWKWSMQSWTSEYVGLYL